MAERNPKTIAEETPELTVFKTPVNIPIKPAFSASAKAAVTSVFPKLLIGTNAPAPANFIKGSYRPNPPKIAPITTSVQVVCAGVTFKVSIISCPITQIKPPIINAKINFSIT